MFAQCSTSFFAQIFHHLHTYRVLEVAREREVPFQATRLETKEEAQNAPTPVTTYALFYNGEYLTNEQMNDKRFIKLLEMCIRDRLNEVETYEQLEELLETFASYNEA